MNILLVEDELLARMTFEQQLHNLGYEVTVCINAEAALECYQQTFYPLIVLDLGLPDMDGCEFCRRIHSLSFRDHSVILAVTGRDAPVDLRAALDAGIDDYLIKPVSQEQLHTRLMILERQRQHATQYKLVGEALQITTQNLLRAQRIGRLGNWDWDVKNQTLTWSDEIYRIFGVERETFALTYEGIEAMVHPDDRGKNQQNVNQLLATADAGEFELRIVRPDGAIRHIYQGLEVSRDPAGTVTKIFGIMQDITARKQAEDDLRHSQEQLRNLSAHLQAIREEERARIAREIHDELGQTLTALKMDVVWLKKRFRKDQSALFEKAAGMGTLLDATLNVVKRLTTELRPGLLDDLGLSAAIAWQAEEFQQHTGIPCDVGLDPDEIIVSEALSTVAFRIFQEALTNVARHAQATHIQVLLQKDITRLYLEVRDNGKGITAEQIADPKSFGLIGMRERAQFLGGQVTFHGVPRQGTTVKVTLPLTSE